MRLFFVLLLLAMSITIYVYDYFHPFSLSSTSSGSAQQQQQSINRTRSKANRKVSLIVWDEAPLESDEKLRSGIKPSSGRGRVATSAKTEKRNDSAAAKPSEEQSDPSSSSSCEKEKVRCRKTCNDTVVDCDQFCECPAPVCVLQSNNHKQKCVSFQNFLSKPSIETESEGVCLGREHGDPRPSLLSISSDSGQQSTSQQKFPDLLRFQKETSWLFQRWFRYGGDGGGDQQQRQCTSIPSPYMTGRHDANGVFRLNNVCISSQGKLSGWKPPKQINFFGKLEVEDPNFLGDTMAEFREWVAKPHPRTEPPACFLDLPMVLFPMGFKSDNTMHVLHRVAPLMQLVAEQFPQMNWRNVTVLYLAFSSALQEMKGNNEAYSFFYQMISGSWASVFASKPTEEEIKTWWKHSSLSSSPDTNFFDSPAEICVKEILVTAPCYRECLPKFRPMSQGRSALKDAAKAIRYRFTWVGRRNPNDALHIQRIKGRISECFGLQLRRKPNVTHPRIFFAVRTRSRRHIGLGTALPSLVKTATNLYNAQSFDVVEPSRLSPLGMVKLAVDADVMLGHIGGGLLWSLLMPMGSVVAEFSHAFGCSNAHEGWNRNKNCDYGGNALAAGLSHLSVHIPKQNTRVDPLSSRHNMFFVGLSAYQEVLGSMVCQLRSSSLTPSPQERIVEEQLTDEVSLQQQQEDFSLRNRSRECRGSNWSFPTGWPSDLIS